MTPLLRILAILVVASTAWSGPAAARAALDIELRARELAAGEGVRIDITSTVPLESLTCSFLGERVFMIRTGDARSWSGWSMIDLDRKAGSAVVEARGVGLDGATVLGTRAVPIAHKDFPQEHLKVAPKYVEPPKAIRERIAREKAKLAVIYARREPWAPPAEPFIRPVPGKPTSIFGSRRVFNGKPRAPHSGLDLRAATGTPVLCSGPGRVVLAEELYYSGNLVIVDHGGGLFTLYAHLSRIDVEEGQDIRPGEQVGLSGATGRVTGPHLHWGAKIDNRPFDPRSLVDPVLFGDRN